MKTRTARWKQMTANELMDAADEIIRIAGWLQCPRSNTTKARRHQMRDMLTNARAKIEDAMNLLED